MESLGMIVYIKQINSCIQTTHTYYTIMESNEIAHYSDYGIQVSDICSELSYFIVFDFPQHQKNQANLARRPTIITYRDDTITFKQLKKRYQKFCPAAKNRKNLRFQLSRGYLIPMNFKVIDLKKSLRRDSLDGVILFTSQALEQDEEQIPAAEGGYVPECGMMDYIAMEDTFDKQKEFSFHFLLPGSKLIITVQINPSERVKVLLQKFFKEVTQEFGVNLGKEHVKQCKIRGGKHKLILGEVIAKHPNLYDNSEIEITLTKEFQFVRKSKEQNIIAIYKDYPNIGRKKTKSLKLVFEDIKNMTVSKINSYFFLDQKQKESKNLICLKVMDFIIKGDEMLMKLSSVIQKLKKLGEVKLVGYIISEKLIFYKQIPQIVSKVGEFTLEQLDIPTEQIKKRDTCQMKVNERLQKIKEAYFREEKHVKSVLIYTSDLKYKDKDGTVEKIYVSLNKWLRDQSVLKIQTPIQQFWFYKYTSTLLKHLKNIKGVSGKVYRGVDYDPEAKVGDSITFKSFTSTSRTDIVSVNFAINGYQQKKRNAVLVLFQMNILSGKPIDMLSYYNNQAQILLEPFTEFKVTNVRKKRYYQVYEFTVFELQEINSDKDMPKSINNYILWVDDKPNEGREVFNQFIDQFNNPSVLFQISSTAQLQNWIDERKTIINDKDSKIIMVTNMVRVENGERNFYAGVQSINLIRTVLPDIPIAVYVRDRRASENNLNTRQVDRKNLIVINQFQELADFAQKHTTLKFRNPFQVEEPIHHTEPVQAKFQQPENKVSKSALQPNKVQKEESKSLCEIM